MITCIESSVHNPAALFAVHNLAAKFRPVNGRWGVLHMAAHADFMLDRHNCVPTLADENPGILENQIRIKRIDELFPIYFQFASARLQQLLFPDECTGLLPVMILTGFEFAFRLPRFRLRLLSFFHEFDFAILNLRDLALHPSNLLPESLEFLVFASLKLLSPKLGDGVLARLDFKLQFLSLQFKLPSTMANLLQIGAPVRGGLLQALLFERHRCEFCFQLSQFLISILEDEQLFNLRKHSRFTFHVSPFASTAEVISVMCRLIKLHGRTLSVFRAPLSRVGRPENSDTQFSNLPVKLTKSAFRELGRRAEGPFESLNRCERSIEKL